MSELPSQRVHKKPTENAPIMRVRRGWAVASTFVILAGTINTPSAVADDKLSVGGGAGIIVDGSYCTLTTIGHDNAGQLVGFTAASCGGPGAHVVAEGAEDRGVLGAVAAVDADLGYAVITFDSGKIVPIADFDGFAIDGIGPDPGFLRLACTQGGATGFGCGQITVANVKPGTMTAIMPAWQPGDEGAPVTVESQLVAMTRYGRTKVLCCPVPLVSTHVALTLFGAILNDANTKGGPGAGFTPIGG